MKKIIFGVLLIIATAIACNKSSQIEKADSSANTTLQSRARTNSENSQRVFSNNYSHLGIAGMTYYDGLNYIGQLHNDYLESLLTQLHSEHVSYDNQTSFINSVQNKTITFFEARNFDVPQTQYTSEFWNSYQLPMTIVNSDYSTEGAQILNELSEILNSQDVEANEDLIPSLEALQNRALELDETEVAKVGVPVTIAIYSYSYWKINTTKWGNNFIYINPNNTSGAKFHFSWGSFGIADAVGGIRGAVAGCGGGPAGAVAGGLVGAAAGSLLNCFQQVAVASIDHKL